MTIHKEGIKIILSTIIIASIVMTINTIFLLDCNLFLFYGISTLSLIFLILVIQFFRIPKRNKIYDKNEIVCPADGKVVVIEETEETEYFNDRRIQVSLEIRIEAGGQILQDLAATRALPERFVDRGGEERGRYVDSTFGIEREDAARRCNR